MPLRPSRQSKLWGVIVNLTENGPSVVIRPMRRDDVAATVALALATPLWQRHGGTPAALTARLEEGLAASAAIWVADAPATPEVSQIAGFVWYVVRGAFQRSGYVMLLGVADQYRRQGIGRMLMAHAEARLFAEADDIFLLVSDFNTPAQRFYRQLGYAQIGAIPDYITPGVAELIFRKRQFRQGRPHEQSFGTAERTTRGGKP